MSHYVNLSAPRLQHCRSCKAPIYWLRNEHTGKSAPIDAHTRGEGNIEIDLDAGSYRVVGALPGRIAYTNHFQTCPHAARWKLYAKGGRP